MKKLLILSCVAAAAASSMANAAQICSATPQAGNGAAIAAGTDFVKVNFTPKCSSNTLVFSSESPTAFGVVAGSVKGKNAFSGSTGGGGVKSTAACASTGCSATEVNQTTADNARDAS